MNKQLMAFYGLKFNPFSYELPTEAILLTQKSEHFCWRIEESLIHEGGFALITGESGTGKSATLRVLAEKLNQRRDANVSVLTHTTASLISFYRELGDMFGITWATNNRWSSFKQLRERWIAQMESTLMRPIVLVDEAQEMSHALLNELRLLTSLNFDSKVALTVILAGDLRLTEKFKHDDLIPLGSRIRVRLNTEHATVEQLLATLKHLLLTAANPTLITPELMLTLSEHAMGNYRALCTMGNELLTFAFKRQQPQLDEKLYFDCFASLITPKKNNRS
jgi:general secretion pathway protein A